MVWKSFYFINLVANEVFYVKIWIPYCFLFTWFLCNAHIFIFVQFQLWKFVKEALLKSLVTFRIHKMSPCFACYRQKLKLVARKARQYNHKLVKGKKKWENFLKKWYLRSVSTNSCLWSFTNIYTSYIIPVYLKLIFVTKVIFKILNG